MKRAEMVATAFAIILGLFVEALAAQPASYPLRVRGGKLRISSQATQTASLVKLIVEFEAGSGAASGALRPGQGSWLDRGMRPGEPARLEYYTHESDAQKIFDYLKSPGNYYTFDCYNTNKGYLQVTKAYTKSVRID
jgi:hypothetical protein